MRKRTTNILLAVALVLAAGVSVALIENKKNEVKSYPIAEHGNHIFRAINQEVILTLNPTPSDANPFSTDWVSSSPSDVSVTKQSEYSAKIKCLTNTFDSVTISVTEFYSGLTETCVCTFYHPITSFTLGLSIDDDVTDTASVAAGGFLSDRIVNTNTQVLPLGTNIGYKLNVTISPSNATYKLFDATFTGALDGDFVAFTGNDPWDTQENINNDGFYMWHDIREVTPIGNPFVFTATSEDGIHSDTLTITIGNELGDSSENSRLADRVKIYTSTSGTIQYQIASTGDSFYSWETKVYDYPESAYIGVNHYIYIAIPAMIGFKATDFTKVFSSTYFEFVSQTAAELSGQNNLLIFKVIAPTGSTPQTITLDMTNYPTAQNLVIPFLLANTATSLGLDTTTVTF